MRAVDWRRVRYSVSIGVAFAVCCAAAVSAAPNAPAIPTGPPWGVQFPGIAEVSVYSKDGAALDALCKGTNRAPIKSLAFERVATGDKSIYKLVQQQATKLNPMAVTVRFKPAAFCTLQLKGAIFAHYGVELAPNQKLAMERFSLAFSQASPVK